MAGRLIAVVGPSGVGKDSLMLALNAARPDWALVRRVITRAPEAGGEDYLHVTEKDFETLAKQNAFCLHWPAHGLFYGIPKGVQDDVQAGATRIVNLSRAVLQEADQAFENFFVLNVTADPKVLAERLAARGREDAQDVAARLARKGAPLPSGVSAATIENNTTVEAACAAALKALGEAQPERA